jgi:exodeoxyribonuclease VII small subunit
MPDQKPGPFEEKVARLEAIAKELESGNVQIERAVALFKEGKTLATECEKLLKDAQQQIDQGMESAGQAKETNSDEEIPF